ncbi:HalOD1 output domain-containing protein [Haloterrigena salinisoli]|uniref:HalOD1 output domain-containing protein n=1 Tax=Haloterrigena salinisoli TaxID=3132747 RepID=UPI0030D53D72
MTDSDGPDTPYEYESEQPPSLAVVTALADLEDKKPTELDYTLYNYIQPQALDTLTQSRTVEITFPIEQYLIHIMESGTIRITS